MPADAQAVTIVASVVLDKLIGLDITKKVTVPRTANLQSVAPAAQAQQTVSAHQQHAVTSTPAQHQPQQQTGHAQTQQVHPVSVLQPQASASQLPGFTQAVPRRVSGPAQSGAPPPSAPPVQPVGLQQWPVAQPQNSRAMGLSLLSTDVPEGVNIAQSSTATNVSTEISHNSSRPGASEQRPAARSRHQDVTGNEAGNAARATAHAPEELPAARMVSAAPVRSGKPRRKLVHALLPPPGSAVQGSVQADGSLPSMHSANQFSHRLLPPTDQVLH